MLLSFSMPIYVCMVSDESPPGQVSVIVTSAGGIEEDFIKCLAPTYLGDFHLPGVELRSKGLNRIGNLVIPNENYCMFEEWMLPILDEMVKEQKEQVGWLVA